MRSRLLIRVLAGLAVGGYIGSMWLPVIQIDTDIRGWKAAGLSFEMIYIAIREDPRSGVFVVRPELIPYLAGSLANVLAVGAGLLVCWKRIPPIVPIGLLGGAAILAHLVPFSLLVSETVLIAGSAAPPLFDYSAIPDAYREFLSGYWLWSGSLGLGFVAALAARHATSGAEC